MKILLKSLFRIALLFMVTLITAVSLVITGIIKITVTAVSSSTMTEIPSYTGKPYVEVNNNEPGFEPEEYTFTAFENYSELDTLGRCGESYALVCEETMPDDERGSISSVIPTGWVQIKYDTSLVPGGYIYNRCHLIGWQLTGENANNRNLITGTRYLNIDGMVGFENEVADYVKNNDGHVLYRVTPIFVGDNLLASGVLMEGYSVDDGGKTICFCVFCFNVQPGIFIDYATGNSSLEQILPGVETVITDEKFIFVVNKTSKKYHLPTCRYASSMTTENTILFAGNHKDADDSGFSGCSVCKAGEKGILLGDVDYSDSVTVADARLILRQAIQLESFDIARIYCSDADLSMDVTVSDARIVLRMAIGLE